MINSIKKYHRTIIFTKVPLNKQFRYKDVFQIFPATLEKMPYSELQRHYPNILEIWTTTDEKINIEMEFEGLKEHYSETATFLNKQDKILSLLSLISNNLFFRYHDLTGIWGMPILKDDPGEEANLWSSKWCWPQFFFPELPKQLQIDDFSTQKLARVGLIPHRHYYFKYPNLDFETKYEIVFPSTIEKTLDAYYKLDNDTMTIVDSAISHIVNAMELRLLKKTLSLLCSFTAIETMVNLEFKDNQAEKCEQCGQLKYGIARKFREFLLKYVATADKNKSKFNSLYSLRSKIIHTGRLVKSEKLFSDVPRSDRDVDFITQVEVLQMGKLSIVNWLLLQSK